MNDYFPLLLGIFVVVLGFIMAMNKGVVNLLASGVSAAAALAVVYAGLAFLPPLGKQYLDIDLTWKFTFGVTATLAFVVFLVCRIVSGIVFKRLFNRDGFLHRLVDGIPGGILSIPASLVAVFIFFTCIRAAGTVAELNYVDSLSRDGIRQMGGSIPGFPLFASWRNGIERMPFLAPLLDLTDPFSRRSARNAAAFVLASNGAALHRHLFNRPATGILAESSRWKEIAADPVVADALAKLDRVALVTSSAIRNLDGDEALRKELSAVDLEPVLREFVESLAPATPQPNPVP